MEIGRKSFDENKNHTANEYLENRKSVAFQNVTKASLPSNGTWSNPVAVGNSDFTISDDASVYWKKAGEHRCSGAELKNWMLENYHISSVRYVNNEPDFSPFLDEKIGAIRLESMPTERDGAEGTFNQAAREAMGRLGLKTISEVDKYMAERELTWHECGDGHTVLAIPTRINAGYKHSGGISVERSIKSMAEVISAQTGGKTLELQTKPPLQGIISASGVSEAIETQKQRFRNAKNKKILPE